MDPSLDGYPARHIGLYRNLAALQVALRDLPPGSCIQATLARTLVQLDATLRLVSLSTELKALSDDAVARSRRLLNSLPASRLAAWRGRDAAP